MTDPGKPRLGEDAKAFICALLIAFCFGLGVPARYALTSVSMINGPPGRGDKHPETNQHQSGAELRTIGNANGNSQDIKSDTDQAKGLDLPGRIQIGLGVATVGATIALVWIGYAQIRVYREQRDLMRGQLQAAVNAASAAQRSADALVSVERPWLVADVEPKRLADTIESATESGSEGFEVRITFVNEGRTSAFAGIFHAESAVADYPRPKSGKKFEVDNEGKAIGQGEDVSFSLGFGLTITYADAIRILQGDAVIWLFGYLEYFDFSNIPQRTYFCFDHNMGMGCVCPWGGRQENYMT